MARYAYDRLSALDNSFLVLETQDAYMHVASTQIHEAGPFKLPDGGIDADEIKRNIEACLHLIPRYRQKLEWIPLQAHPVWVDDGRFNIDYHIRHTSLPRPGTTEQLKRLSARIMQQHLDRRRPLWEMWIVEGLEDDRFAVISKVHHCMVDGMSGVDIMKVLMSPDPGHETHDTPNYIPRPAPSRGELWAAEMMRWASLPMRAVTSFGHLIGEARDIRRRAITTARAVASTLGTSLRPASATPINGHIGPHRRFAWLTMDLADIKDVRKALGGSLNDIVLTIVTGAVRRFFERRQADPSRISFRVMTPVSVRTQEEHGTMGNRVSAWVVDLPIAEREPARQLEGISHRTMELKRSKNALGADALFQVAEWTPSTLLSLAGRNVTRMLPFNMVVTNVPGPQMPMYMFGSRMVEAFPHVPLTENLGLGIALLSYDGKLCWGFNADYDLVPDLPAFTRAIEESFDDVRQLAIARRPELADEQRQRRSAASVPVEPATSFADSEVREPAPREQASSDEATGDETDVPSGDGKPARQRAQH